jgi:hypothetical protein
MTDGAKTRVYQAVIVLLLLAIAALAWKVIVAGSTQAGGNGRIAINLDPGERALMLREMREFVAGVQRIVDALSRDDMQAVAKASRSLGGAKAHDVPVAMLAKLPLEFKTLAFSTHGAFDAIAADAEANGTPKHAMAQLADALQKCVACHARYEVKAGAGNP